MRENSRDIDVSHLMKTGEEKVIANKQYRPLEYKPKHNYNKIEHKSLVLDGSKAKKVDLAYNRQNIISGKDNTKNKKRERSAGYITLKDDVVDKPVDSFSQNKTIMDDDPSQGHINEDHMLDALDQNEFDECVVEDTSFIGRLMGDIHVTKKVS